MQISNMTDPSYQYKGVYRLKSRPTYNIVSVEGIPFLYYWSAVKIDESGNCSFNVGVVSRKREYGGAIDFTPESETGRTISLEEYHHYLNIIESMPLTELSYEELSNRCLDSEELKRFLDASKHN